MEQRVQGIVRLKKAEIDRKYPKPTASFEEMYKEIKEGTAKLKDYEHLTYSRYLSESFTYSFSDKIREVEDVRNTLKAEVDAKAQRLTDTLYFADTPNIEELFQTLENITI